LRERREDISALAVSLLARVAPNRRLALSPQASRRLEQPPFPGNVRELRNVPERASLPADGPKIELAHVEQALAVGPVPGRHEPLHDSTPMASRATAGSLREIERRNFRAVVAAHRGPRQELADKLGISVRSLYRKLRETDESAGQDNGAPGG
jgi:DNA-binding NtrC family response regulator